MSAFVSKSRKKYRDESWVGLLMDLPYWVVVLTFLLVWAALAVTLIALGLFVQGLRGVSVLGVGALLWVAVSLSFWVALGERSRRRRRLQLGSDLHRLRGLSPSDFEFASTELFRLQGYVVTENKTTDEADGGVDFEIAKVGETLLVQCKQRWGQDVTVREARELWGIVASEGAAGGVLVTSGRFTQPTIDFAQGKRLLLIDGPEYLRLRALALPPLDINQARDPMVSKGFAAHLAAQVPPVCERCGKQLQVVTHLSGTTITRQFWGCPSYPDHTFTRPFASFLADEGGPMEAFSVDGWRERWAVATSNRVKFWRK